MNNIFCCINYAKTKDNFYISYIIYSGMVYGVHTVYTYTYSLLCKLLEKKNTCYLCAVEYLIS